ncbi:MAG: BtpA/SgcQ family protein [Verrucomicrobia bacterium]|nr:BtpA/SgcQ family protein [Verrucomicrobiota bacterium]
MLTGFPNPKPLVGMLHVPALPGTPRAALAVPELVRHTLGEAQTLETAGVQGLLIENMHDVPYLKGSVGPEVTAVLAAVAVAVRQNTGLPVGIQVLAAANREALAVALAAQLQFVRVEGFVYAHVADEGLIEASAGELLRYRRNLGATHIRVWADVKKKHASHALTADVDLVETAQTAAFFGADALIVTGRATGQEASPEDVRACQAAVPCPIIVGSGVTAGNLSRLWPCTSGFIVGSSLKQAGRWGAPIDRRAVQALVDRHGELQSRA